MVRNPLPYVGTITNGEKDLGLLANEHQDLLGKNVLCIGLSEAEISEFVSPFEPRAITSLTLWENHVDADTTRFQLVVGDITKKTQFRDEEFDVVITLSLFEHLDPLEEALIEMKRITKHGGIIASMFGPVWSNAYGHHLYAINDKDPLLNFSLWKMPAFMHLIWNVDQIRAFYSESGYSLKNIEEIIYYMFEWNGINRIMMDDYIRLFFKHFHVEFLKSMTNEIPSQLVNMLQEKYPQNSDFHSYGAKVILRKL